MRGGEAERPSVMREASFVPVESVGLQYAKCIIYVRKL